MKKALLLFMGILCFNACDTSNLSMNAHSNDSLLSKNGSFLCEEFTKTNYQHVAEGRAEIYIQYYVEYARTIGSGEDLGMYGSQWYSPTTTVSETALGYFVKGSCPVEDTEPPVVNVTSPVNNSQVGETTKITASASDNVGVVRVEFYINGSHKKTVDNPPYEYSHTASIGSEYTIMVKAYDAADNEAIDNDTSVTVIDMPFVCTSKEDTNSNHETNGRAYKVKTNFWLYEYYAVGSDDHLGYSWSRTTVRESSPGFYEKGPCQEISSCEQIPRENLMVALVLGQSNAADFGQTVGPKAGTAYAENVFTMRSNGNCEQLRDPISWVSTEYGGYAGSVWSRLGPKLVANGSFDNVLIISVAHGGVRVKSYLPGSVIADTALHDLMLQAIDAIHAKNFTITHILWHQGESDTYVGENKLARFPYDYFLHETTTEEYIRDFKIMLASIRDRGVTAPIYPAVATACPGGQGYDEQLPSDRIRSAQMALGLMHAGTGQEDLDIWPGPDTDEIRSKEYRYDQCHMNDLGLDLHSDMWVNKLTQ